MGNVVTFESKKDQFDKEELLAFKGMVEIQLQAARSFSMPLLENLVWINEQLLHHEFKQLNLPFEENLLEIGHESYFN